ncbi:MAG: outer membrane protein assembly factor BamD [Gammaproteobacteria bacterium]|nr:outer membrane protein assembly factor BamD [Gammaproteobacteria bacterium]
MQPNSEFMKQARLLVIILFGTLLVACAGNDEQRTEVQNITEAYEKAQEFVARGNYRRGIQIFEAIQARYPFSDLSRQIQLELMYAYYKGGQSEQAVDAAETFIRENPIHPRVDYALYIQGLSYFEDDPGLLERWFRKDTSNRPPKEIELAYSSLRRLVERFPSSEYAPDAEQRMLYIKNRLADYENHVADYYLRRGAYVAALNRARAALEQFNGATGNARSLEIMAAAYDNLGMADLAVDTRRVLAENFPNES